MPFDEEELDPHGECAAEIKRLRDALTAIYTLDQGASELKFIARVQAIAARALSPN